MAFNPVLLAAMGDVPQDETAFPARDATWFAMAGAFDVPGLVHDGNRPLIQAEWDAIEALGAGLYGNFTPSTDPGLVTRMFSPETMARLAQIKRQYDPQNLFCRNHNIVPA